MVTLKSKLLYRSEKKTCHHCYIQYFLVLLSKLEDALFQVVEMFGTISNKYPCVNISSKYPCVNSTWDKSSAVQILVPYVCYYLTLLFALVKSVFLFNLGMYQIDFYSAPFNASSKLPTEYRMLCIGCLILLG